MPRFAALSVQQPCGDRAPVREQIVEIGNRRLEVASNIVRCDQYFLVLTPDVLCDVGSMGPLVEFRIRQNPC